MSIVTKVPKTIKFQSLKLVLIDSSQQFQKISDDRLVRTYNIDQNGQTILKDQNTNKTIPITPQWGKISSMQLNTGKARQSVSKKGYVRFRSKFILGQDQIYEPTDQDLELVKEVKQTCKFQKGFSFRTKHFVQFVKILQNASYENKLNNDFFEQIQTDWVISLMKTCNIDQEDKQTLGSVLNHIYEYWRIFKIQNKSFPLIRKYWKIYYQNNKFGLPVPFKDRSIYTQIKNKKIPCPIKKLSCYFTNVDRQDQELTFMIQSLEKTNKAWQSQSTCKAIYKNEVQSFSILALECGIKNLQKSPNQNQVQKASQTQHKISQSQIQTSKQLRSFRISSKDQKIDTATKKITFQQYFQMKKTNTSVPNYRKKSVSKNDVQASQPKYVSQNKQRQKDQSKQEPDIQFIDKHSFKESFSMSQKTVHNLDMYDAKTVFHPNNSETTISRESSILTSNFEQSLKYLPHQTLKPLILSSNLGFMGQESLQFSKKSSGNDQNYKFKGYEESQTTCFDQKTIESVQKDEKSMKRGNILPIQGRRLRNKRIKLK